MSTGSMKPISFKRPVLTKTLTGGMLENYVPAGSDWAEVKSLSQSFQNVAGQKADGQQVQFKIRYRRSLEITDKWLVVFEGRDYKLLSVEREKLKQEYFLVVGKAVR